MATKRALTIEDFDLHKVKYNSKTGIEIEYFEKGDRKDAVTVKSDTPPHVDLLEKFKELAPHLAHILGLQRGWDFAREATKDDLDVLKNAVSGAKAADEAITVSGIRLAGEGKNASVKVTGSLKCLTGSIGFASPLIVFANTALAIEQTIEGICDEIKDEVYAYLFQNKVAAKQEKMNFDEGGEETETGKKKRGRKPGKQTDLVEEANKADKAEDGDTDKEEEENED